MTAQRRQAGEGGVAAAGDPVWITRRMTEALRRTRFSALAAGAFTFLIAASLLLASAGFLVSAGLNLKTPGALPPLYALFALCAASAFLAGLWSFCFLRYGTAGGEVRSAEAVERALIRHGELWLAFAIGLPLMLALAGVVVLRPAAFGALLSLPLAENPRPPAAGEPVRAEEHPDLPLPRVVLGAEPGEEGARLDRECGEPGRTYLCLLPERGEPVSGGTRLVADLRTATFHVQPQRDLLEIHVEGSTAGDWRLEFAPPKGQSFQQALYQGAQRAPFRKGRAPGLSVTGRSGCNVIHGQFRVWAFDLDANGRLRRFAADFEQRCDGFPTLLVGRIAAERAEPPPTPL
ncbi:MAG TPA: hypothetical protein VGS07_15910 [Thermoanaerobaculia bacterium]|jgi:hypothetical protein|nr:hypothetical protein [Thermoanaerobaculia bacterium]